MARSAFLLIFGFSVSFINTFLINVGSFLIARILSPNNFLLLTVGALGAQIITFLIISSIVLFLGSLFGIKIGRSIPATIFACSYVIANFVNVSESYMTSTPINLINDTFNNEVNKNISTIKSLQSTDTSQSEKYTKINSLSNNNKSFIPIPGNRLKCQNIIFKDVNNADIEILINDKNANIIFQLLHNSFINKSIKANNFLLAIDYINPMSGVLKIARTNVEKDLINDYVYQLSGYSNYYNIAPSFSNNEYFNFDKTNNFYFTTFREEKLDES